MGQPNVFVTNGPTHPVYVTGSIGGLFSAPSSANYQALTYYGSTNNVHTIVYKSGGSGGTTVSTLTFVYAGGGAANDDLVTSITQS